LIPITPGAIEVPEPRLLTDWMVQVVFTIWFTESMLIKLLLKPVHIEYYNVGHVASNASNDKVQLINQLVHSESEISGEIRCPTPPGPANVITPRIIVVPELDIASDIELKALRRIGAFRRPHCKHDTKESVVQFVLEIVRSYILLDFC
jgi:hypothetical protein